MISANYTLYLQYNDVDTFHKNLNPFWWFYHRALNLTHLCNMSLKVLKDNNKMRDVVFLIVVVRPTLICCGTREVHIYMVYFDFMSTLACWQMLIAFTRLLCCIKHLLPSFHSRHGLHVFPPVTDLHRLFLQTQTQKRIMSQYRCE